MSDANEAARIDQEAYARSLVPCENCVTKAAEIERLRAALLEIAEENIGNTAAISVYIARAALEDRT